MRPDSIEICFRADNDPPSSTSEHSSLVSANSNKTVNRICSGQIGKRGQKSKTKKYTMSNPIHAMSFTTHYPAIDVTLPYNQCDHEGGHNTLEYKDHTRLDLER